MDGRKIQRTLQICRVDGCEQRANRVGAKLCEKHYMRLRRKGTTDKTTKPERIEHSHGYVLVAPKDHPLMQGKPSGSRIYEHRMVFFDKYGGGEHQCYWCGDAILFQDMHVDHLNAVKHDNRIDNLVAACPACNRARGIQKMTETKRQSGLMLTYNGETKHVSQWASDIGISSFSLRHRLKNGWSIEDAVTKPRGKFGPKAVG